MIMKKAELTKLRAKGVDVLKKMAADRRIELTKVKADTKAAREKNLKKVKNLRRDIAQILTLVREKELTATQRRKEDTKDAKK